MVDVAEVPALDQAARREGDPRLIGMRTPFAGKTPTGGERTRFLPRSSKNFSKPFLKNHFNTIKPLSVDYMPVNLHPVLRGWSRTKDSYSESSQPRTILNSSTIQIIRNSGRTASVLPLPRSNTPCMQISVCYILVQNIYATLNLFFSQSAKRKCVEEEGSLC